MGVRVAGAHPTVYRWERRRRRRGAHLLNTGRTTAMGCGRRQGARQEVNDVNGTNQYQVRSKSLDPRSKRCRPNKHTHTLTRRHTYVRF